MKLKNNITFKNNFFNKSNKKNNKKNIFQKLNKYINQQNSPLDFLSTKNSLQLNIKKLNKFKKFKTIVILGMGGSILGTKSIYSIFEKKIKKKFIFIDNIDNEKIQVINKYYRKSLFIIVSKSGETIETLTNLNALSNVILKAENTIVITENTNNTLNNFAIKKNIYRISHKNFIGGRYSVLTEVGMVPSFFMGLNLKNFRVNIKNILNNSLIETTNTLSKFYKNRKISSIIFLNYSPILNDLICWCQQLIAESLGKKNMGLLPVLSEGPKDHHSLLQLYLDGPKDKIFYIFSFKEKNQKKLKKNMFKSDFNFLKNKTMSQISFAQKNAFKEVLKKKKINFKEIIFNKLDENSLADFYSYFILETVLTASQINVNPFGQPAVESVKKIAKKNLKSSKINF